MAQLQDILEICVNIVFSGLMMRMSLFCKVGSDGNGSNQYTFEFPDCYVLPDQVNEEQFLSHNAPLFMLKKFDGDINEIIKQIGMWW